MPIITAYVCDRCGHSQPTDDQMWQVGVACHTTRSTVYSLASDYRTFQSTRMWCRGCCETVGVLPPAGPRKGEMAMAQPSFEDIVRDIIREEIEAARQ